MRRMAVRATVAASLLACVPLALGAQETVDARRAIAPDASVKIWNGGGSVRVVGTDVDSLTVTGRVAGAAGGRFFLRAEGDAVKLGVEGDQAEVRGELTVRLPRGATVWVRSVTADVSVRDLRGSVDVHSVGGRVEFRGRPEMLYAESMEGDLDLRVEGGVVRGRSGTGRITFAGTARDLSLETVSGAVELTTPGLRRVRVTTVDGDVSFAGGVRSAGALAVETHAGDVTLRLPGDLSADFELSSFEGDIDAGYAGAPRAGSGPGRRSVIFETGDGGARVEVRTFSGSIEIVPR